ncbi:TonB-dependent receptor [Pseudoteredinibacter isoporae]|uniref:TonB-dependent receptor n=1 Tax=Pseudoteredinibacter isoporae TaxID=570281 RepID=UPI003342BED1
MSEMRSFPVKPLLGAMLAGSMLAADWAAAQIEEVMVTAQRRTESAQDVPVSLTAYSAEDLKIVNVTRSSQLAAQTPNMVAVDGNFGLSAPIISMRGVSNVDFSAISNTPIAVYSDGVILNNIQTHGFAMFDLERVEILRGPQGTLFGRNSTTGAMQVFSARPTEEFSAGVEVTLGRFDRSRQEAFVSGKLTDSARARLAYVSNRSSGYVKDQLGRDAQNEDVQAARFSLDWDATEALKVEWRLAHQQIDNKPVVFHNQLPTNVFDPTSPGGSASDFRRVTLSPSYERKEKGETIMSSLTVDWDLGDVNLVSVTGIVDHDFQYQNDEDASTQALGHSQAFTGQRQLTQEFRLQGQTDRLDWVAGVFFMDEEVESQTSYDINGILAALPHGFVPGSDGTIGGFDAALGLGGAWIGSAQLAGFEATDSISVAQAYNVLQAVGRLPQGNVSTRANKHKQNLESMAVFSHLKYRINDYWGATMGLRWSRDEKDLNGQYLGCYVGQNPNRGQGRFDLLQGIGIDLNAPGGFDLASLVMDPEICGVNNGQPENFGGDASWDSLSGKLSFEYTPDEESLYYFGVSRGFKGGSFNGTFYNRLVEVEPEKLTSFELGTKHYLLDRRMTLNAALFQYDYTDFQAVIAVTLPSALQGTTVVNELVNVPDSTIRGAELEMAYNPITNLVLTLGASWLDSKVDKQPTVSAGTIPNIRGNEFRYAPEFTFNGVLSYTIEMNDWGYLTPQLDWSYTDAYFTDIGNNPLGRTDDNWMTNVRLNWSSSDERLNATLFVENVTDEVYNSSNTREFTASFGTTFSTYSKPRTVGLTLSYRL